MSKLKVLITGSGGFLMCNLVRRAIFSKKNWKIASLDKIRQAYVKHNIYINKDHNFYPVDILSKHFLDVTFEIERPDVVIHGAFEKYHNIVENNVVGTQNVIDACNKWDVKKLVFISTNKVYNPSQSRANESTMALPKNQYAASKFAAEVLVNASNLNHVILRLGESYGPWQNVKNFIPSIIDDLLSERNSSHEGSSLDARDWCHVHDTCEVIMTAAESEMSGTYNASSGQELTFVEVYNKVANLLKKSNSLQCTKESTIQSFLSDNNKISELWRPAVPFKDGISHTVQWYLDNKYFLNYKDNPNG